MEHDQAQRERFATLIRQHGRSMFRAARAVLDCDADAEDAVGEAILLAWQSFPRLRRAEAAGCWLLRITVNCAYAQRRRERRVVYLDDLEQVAGATEEETAPDLWQAVLRLPEDQRLAVTLYYYEDLPVADIARALGVPQGTVKSRLSRGRDRLRQILREEEQDGIGPQRI